MDDDSSPPRRGKINVAGIDEIVVLAIIVATFLIVFVCFASMIFRVWQVERQLFYGQSNLRHHPRRLAEAKKCHKNTKIIIIQSFAYFGSYLLTLGCCLVRYLYDDALWVFRLQIVVLPLQGFFNALIFISMKVYNFRRAHEGHSICRTLKLLFQGEAEEAFIFSRISLICQDLEEPTSVIVEDKAKVADGETSNKNMIFQLGSIVASKSPAKKSAADSWEDEEKLSNDGLSGFSTLLHDGDILDLV